MTNNKRRLFRGACKIGEGLGVWFLFLGLTSDPSSLPYLATAAAISLVCGAAHFIWFRARLGEQS
jgi:hypothetical protein